MISALNGLGGFRFNILTSPGNFTAADQGGFMMVSRRSFFGYDDSADVLSGFRVSNTDLNPTSYTGTLMNTTFGIGTLDALVLGGHSMDCKKIVMIKKYNKLVNGDISCRIIIKYRS